MELLHRNHLDHSPRNQVIRRMFAVAINHDPYALYHRLPNDEPDGNLAYMVVNYLKPELVNSKKELTLLTAGLHDVERIVKVALNHDGNNDQELAYDVVSNPETAETIAEISRRYQEMVRNAINSDVPGNNFYISREDRALKVGAKLSSSASIPEGCPFAGKMPNGKNGEIDPLFKRFVPWAGTLAVRRYFDPAYRS